VTSPVPTGETASPLKAIYNWIAGIADCLPAIVAQYVTEGEVTQFIRDLPRHVLSLDNPEYVRKTLGIYSPVWCSDFQHNSIPHDGELEKIKSMLGYAKSKVYGFGREVSSKKEYEQLKRNTQGLTAYEIAVERRKLKTMMGVLSAKNGKAVAVKSQRIGKLFPLLHAVATARLEIELRKSTIGIGREYEKITTMLEIAARELESLK
jgi:hypothetical protein